MKNRTFVRLTASISLAAAPLACGGAKSDGKPACTSAPLTTNAQPSTCNDASFVLHDENNYAFSSEIKLPPVTVKSKSNLTVDWSAVTQDFVGHPLDPVADLNSVLLMLWHVPLSQFESQLNADKLDQLNLEGGVPPALPPPNHDLSSTSAHAYDFTVNGYPLPPSDFEKFLDPTMQPPNQTTYLVAVSTGKTPGQGFRMLQTFKVEDGASSTTVALKNDSVHLTCQVGLRSLTIIGVPGSTPGLTLDYTQVTKNWHGAEFDPAAITSVVVGHYDERPEELETRFLDLDLIAKEYYSGSIEDVGTVDFTKLKDKKHNDAAFPGVDDNGTWLVGLICGGCKNPAPLYMTILKPCTK